jgi:hypothetical protein
MGAPTGDVGISFTWKRRHTVNCTSIKLSTNPPNECYKFRQSSMLYEKKQCPEVKVIGTTTAMGKIYAL